MARRRSHVKRVLRKLMGGRLPLGYQPSRFRLPLSNEDIWLSTMGIREPRIGEFQHPNSYPFVSPIGTGRRFRRIHYRQ